jgi:uncharacterized protein YdaU (DUF1376 family)
MPLYIADYLADTGHLTTEEHGAYLLLTMHYWRTGGLPQGDGDLATLCRLSPKRWSQIGPKIARLFKDGWRHKRIDAELIKAEEKHRKRAEAGKRGGSAKAGAKQNPSNALANGCQSQPDKGSEATASGGKPPDPQDIETPKARLWREAQPAMVAMGVAPKLCGEMIGKWCSFVANDYDRVRRTILSAQKEAPLGPIAWITAILGPEKANARKGESLISIAAREQHERAVLASVRDTADHDAPRLLSAGRGG